MKKIGEIALGVITSIGGFLEVGSIATSAQAGSEFRYQLGWAVVLGVLSLTLLMEMGGRLSAVSKRTVADQLRERFGMRFFMVPLVVTLVVSWLVLAAEIGGVGLALQMVTGIAFRWWALPIALVGWLLLWLGTFKLVENGTAILGLVSLAFLVGLVVLHPHWRALASGLAPSAPSEHPARYWYLAVSILGASISPYLFFFYSSGAIEDRWEPSYLAVNRATALLGNLFGGGLAVVVVAVAALVFLPHGIRIERYEQLGMILTPPLGRAGFLLFLSTLFVTCFGSTVEVTLAMAYLLAQGLGWDWGESVKPAKNARFAVAYTAIIFSAALPMLAGLDPLGVTNFAMVLTAASLPVSVVPLLVLMNDRNVMMRHVNRWWGNLALGLVAVLSVILLVVALPLQLLGGS